MEGVKRERCEGGGSGGWSVDIERNGCEGTERVCVCVESVEGGTVWKEICICRSEPVVWATILLLVVLAGIAPPKGVVVGGDDCG